MHRVSLVELLCVFSIYISYLILSVANAKKFPDVKDWETPVSGLKLGNIES